MDYYTVVYVGYEGIEHIIDTFLDPKEAAERVTELRKLAEENSKLDEDTLYNGPYPEHCWAEPDRVCVMTKKPRDKTYSCCCDFCGVEPTRYVLY